MDKENERFILNIYQNYGCNSNSWWNGAANPSPLITYIDLSHILNNKPYHYCWWEYGTRRNKGEKKEGRSHKGEAVYSIFRFRFVSTMNIYSLTKPGLIQRSSKFWKGCTLFSSSLAWGPSPQRFFRSIFPRRLENKEGNKKIGANTEENFKLT